MSTTFETKPREDGFRMPGEFEPHTGTWMIWPERPDNWRLGAKPAQKVFCDVARAISEFEPVTMCVSHNQWRNARHLLPANIRIVEMSSDDSWMRDCGATYITNSNGLVRGIDWDFNAWGGLHSGLYFPWDKDDMVARKMMDLENIDRYKAPLVLEGGSIHVDGQGTLITTEECLLNENRNPQFTKSEIENHLADYLNIDQFIWLEKGIYNDETNGHVDNICCFIKPGVVALAWCDDPADPQYDISHDAYERLMAAFDARGRKLEVHKIHIPDPILITEKESLGVDTVEGTLPRQAGDRLAGSYINFYVCNGGIVMPIFNDRHDQQAIQTLAALFPDRKVTPILAREILLGGGNIHCITQQQPRG